MLQSDRIAYYFSLTHELPEVEFKGPGRRGDSPLFGRVVRAAMAMTNRRNGGTIIIGVSEQSMGFSFEGLTPEQLATWKYEDIAGGFNSHASSPIEFERIKYEHEGKTFLILDVHEFATVPVMCIKDYYNDSNSQIPKKDRSIILHPCSFYIRTLNKPESKRMETSEETRILFELASNKAVQSFVTLTKLAGINIAPQPEDKDLFARQVEGWTGPLLTDIDSRGYWDIRIRPVTFQLERLPLADLQPVLQHSSVNYRGWEFPYITPQISQIGNDWIGLENQLENILQSWRFFQSGQFAAAVGFIDDWDEKLNYRTSITSAPGSILSVIDVVWRFTEIFGIASRLAITDAYRDEQYIAIDVSLCNVQNRQLYGRGIYQIPSPLGFRTATSNISYPHTTFAKADIIARWQELAREVAAYIFERFGWQPSDQLLTTIQSQLNVPQ